MSWCVLFAGQSIQERGMGRALWRLGAAREPLRRLTEILGGDLEYLMTEAPNEELAKTRNAQRAIHASHVVHWELFREAHPELRLSGAIGHSMGVVAALHAAGAMSLEDSALFIRARAEAFDRVCSNLKIPYGLAAVSSDELEGLLDELKAFPDLQVALYNTARRLTLGGPIESLEGLARRAEDEGWPVRVQLLDVEGPYHTPPFAPCLAELRSALETLPIHRPQVPVFMGTSGRAETDPGRIRELLVEQPVSTEKHLEAVRQAYEAGCRDFLEVSFKPQPIGWLKDQLTSIEGVNAWEVRTADLAAPAPA